jgi:hypothetical protein
MAIAQSQAKPNGAPNRAGRSEQRDARRPPAMISLAPIGAVAHDFERSTRWSPECDRRVSHLLDPSNTPVQAPTDEPGQRPPEVLMKVPVT